MASIQCLTNGSQLAAFLRESYQELRGKRLSSSSEPFLVRIDGHRSTDVSPDFCFIWVLIQDTRASKFTLRLKNPPLDDDVRELIYSKGGTITGLYPDLTVEIPFLTKEVGVLRKHAKAFRRVVGKGRTYPNPNWKWVCRRMGASLDLLANRLMEYRKLRRHTPWQLSHLASSVNAPGSAVSAPPKDHLGVGTTTQVNQVEEEGLFRLLEMG